MTNARGRNAVSNPHHPTCPMCEKARRFSGDDELALARAIKAHPRCSTCGILIGSEHIARTLDSLGRCADCERVDYAVPTTPGDGH